MNLKYTPPCCKWCRSYCGRYCDDPECRCHESKEEELSRAEYLYDMGKDEPL